MFKKTMETIIGGAIGMLALYAVAKVAYSAGYERAESDHEQPEEVGEETPVTDIPAKKVGKLSFLWGLRKMMGKKESAIGDLLNNPEEHQVEAYVEEGEIHVNIKKKRSSSAKITKPSMET